MRGYYFCALFTWFGRLETRLCRRWAVIACIQILILFTWKQNRLFILDIHSHKITKFQKWEQFSKKQKPYITEYQRFFVLALDVHGMAQMQNL